MFIKLTCLDGYEYLINTSHILYLGAGYQGTYIVLQKLDIVLHVKETVSEISKYIDSPL